MKVFAYVFLVLISVGVPVLAGAGDNSDPIIQSVVDRLKQDITTMSQYGSHQRVMTTKLTEQGTPKRIEEKNLRTIWVHNKPHNETLNFTCKEIDKSGKTRRCPNDLRKVSSTKKDSKPGKIESEIKKIRWTELHKNYDFTLLPPEGPYNVISFRPRGGTTPTNRIEKLLCQMAGKVWVDRQFNVVKAEAQLINTVSFGLGVAAKVHHLAIQYKQQPYKTVWLPSYLILDFKAKVALVHTERQRIEVFWTGPYRKSDTVWAQAGSLPVGGTSKR